MEIKNISSVLLNKITGIDCTSICKYRADERKPNLEYAVSLCIALRLTSRQADYLLELCSYSVKADTPENKMYRLFIDTCAFIPVITVAKCNEMLIEKNLKPLTKLRVLSLDL